MVSRFGKALGRIAALWRKAGLTGNVLCDASGVQIGNIDVIQISATHLRVAGWVAAPHVTLRVGQGQVNAAPTLTRPDVAAAFGITAAAGFDLTMPRDAGQAQLIIALSDAQHIIQPLPVPHRPARQRRRLGPVG